MRSAHPRFGCFLSCTISPLYSSAPPTRRWPVGLGSPALCGPRSAPRVSTFSTPSRHPGSRDTADRLMVSFPLPEALICAQPYLRVILAQRGGSRQSGGQRLLSCYLVPVCVWVLILVWLSPMSPGDLEKQPREGQSGCISPPSSTPSLSPCHSSCSPLWGGLGSGAVSRPPLHFPLLFSALRSTPLRPIAERSGLSAAGDDRGVGRGGLAGVARPA